MRKLSFIIGLCVFFLSCEKDSDNGNSNGGNGSSKDEWVCGTYNGKTLYTGPRGGCYYYQSDREKTYVDRKHCSCLK